MKQKKKDITSTSQLVRDEASRLVEECVHGFLENRDEAKALALLEKVQLCINDAQSIEKKDRIKRLN